MSNGGDVAGIAVAISNASDQVIWDTRTYASDPAGEYYSTGGGGQYKGGDGGGAGGGGGGYPGGFGGSVRGGDTGGYGGYRGVNAIVGAVETTIISDTTKSSSAYIKLTW